MRDGVEKGMSKHKELIIKQGDKIACPNCGHEAKAWDGHTTYYGFLCYCRAIVKMQKMLGGWAKVYVEK